MNRGIKVKENDMNKKKEMGQHNATNTSTYFAVASNGQAASLLKTTQHLGNRNRPQLAQVTNRDQDPRVQLSNINRLGLLATSIQILQ